MTSLNRPVKRTNAGMVREGGKMRAIIITIRPPNIIGFRAKGCHKEYQLTTEACYIMAVRAQVLDLQKQKKLKRRHKGEQK